MAAVISKSKYIAGLQCPRLLWFHYNDREAIPPPGAARQAIFDTGHAVGDLAKTLFPGGLEVAYSRDLAETTRRTAELLAQRKPIFEASFAVDGCYCRADILVPADGGAWDLYEVKSGTRLKDENVADVAFQTHAIERCDVVLDRLFLMHVDNTYVRRGEIDPARLLVAEDITDRARAVVPEVAGNVARLLAVIEGECPATGIGAHCSKPYACDLWPACSAFLPEHHVLELNYIRKTEAFRLLAGGRAAIVDVPASELNANQRVQQEAIRTGTAHVNARRIRGWLAEIAYPLYCLDFETMNPAIPLLDGTRPYQQIPFQMSLHVIERPGATARHVAYLAGSPEDPRPGLITALKAIGPSGTILAWNMSFEQRVIRELAAAFPAEEAFLTALGSRFRDLMTPFRSFWFHDVRQHGSCSLKDVLPVLTGASYDGMAVADGGQAMREYQRVVFGDVDPGEKARVLQALKEYCEQDTRALVDVLEALETLAP
ncbi:MAG: DUF2779 domain-containing protein [Candidatus Krumholzibacteriia bacterium]